MKFRIRNDFVVHNTRLVSLILNGEETKQPQTNSYYGGQDVDFDESEAAEHAHKLEPLDKAAAKYLESLVRPIDTPVGTSGIDQAALANAIAQGVAQALAAIQAAPAPVAPAA